MALKLEVVKKIHDKGRGKKLIGYTVRDESGKEMNIDKESLKQAINENKVEVTNMTVTEDGRLLGAAKPTDRSKNKKEISYKVVEVYTLGDKIIGALVDESEAVDAGIIDNHDIEGLQHGFTFEVADVVLDRMESNVYSNIKVNDGNVSSDIIRVDFGTVKNSMFNLLRLNNITIDINDLCVEPNITDECTDIDGYTISNPLKTNANDTIRRIVMLLITNKMYEIGYNVKCVNDENIVVIGDDAQSIADSLIYAFE